MPTLRATLGSAALFFAAACAGDSTTAPVKQPGITPSDSAPSSSQTTGVIVIAVDGLSAGSAADITLTPPSGAPIAVNASTQLNSATAGVWRVSAAPVTAAGSTFRPDSSDRNVTLAKGDTVRVPVRYALVTGSIAIAITGLPDGTAGSVAVTGPGGFSHRVSSTSTLTGLEPGSYVVTAAAVTAGGIDYAPAPATRTVVVTASAVAAAAPVAYEAQAGRLVISTSGLPADLTPTFTLTGAGGARTVIGDATIDLLALGRYELYANIMGNGTSRYAPTVVTNDITIGVGTTTTVTIRYVPIATAGTIALTVSGLPEGSGADVLMTGPGGFSRVITSSSLLTALAPGRYTFVARAIRTAAGAFGVTPSQRDIDVAAGDSAALGMSYAPLPAVIEVPVTGAIPAGAARLTITAPSGNAIPVTSSRVLEGAPGRWRLTAASITSGGNSYAPNPASYDESVLAGDTLRLPVAYAISSGSIAIAISGLPAGASGSVTVSGPGGFSQSVTATTTLTNLVPGTYTVSAVSVTSGGKTYAPVTATRTVTVVASVVAAPAPVAYVVAIGRLTITASGLPDGAVPTFTLTGSTGSRTLNGVGTTDSLAPGGYTVTAGAVGSGSSIYTPAPAAASVTITAGAAATAAFTYATSSGPPSGANVSIENVYVTQTVQNWAGTAPIVVGRDALVRVFVKASGDNTWQPDVRVRIYDGASLLQSFTIPATGAGVTTTISEGSMSASWNVVIPASNVRANLKVLADVDPSNALGETYRADNTWPVNGVPASVVTTTAPLLTLRFVPVTLSGMTGGVNDANKEQFLQTARRLLPLNQITSSVRAPFTSNAPELQSNNANGAWTIVLSEINALRSTDGASSTTNYLGIVKVGYGSGVAGFGYIPGRAAVAWDNLPAADGIAAHELGHNFSRPHTPCGVSGDANYPYPGGVIGAWGWNASGNALVAPSATDIMGYCGNQWISDWSWSKMAAWRSAAGMEAPAAAVGDALLVWGRIIDGRVVLEPAFRVRARATPRAAKSSYRIVLSDADDGVRLDIPVDPEIVDHETSHDERQFAVVVPWSDQLDRDVARIAVREARSPFPAAVRMSGATARAGAAVAMPDPMVAVRADGRRSQVEWDASRYPMAMVRDAATGEILSFLRKPGDAFTDQDQPVEIVFSDGVRSTPRAVAPRRAAP